MMIHCRSPSEKPRSVWAAGRAMFTTVESSTTISWARATVVRVHQRRDGGGVGEDEEARVAPSGEVEA
ncbi:hypothetical protein ASE87_15480 [Frigoribacterium sp. Leaf44]|nr:hypothetical protein ASE87_15480 [Frigoribacterium sp. Leaf44]